METKEEILFRLNAQKKFKERDVSKLLNSTYYREYCHLNGVKISREAIIELSKKNKELLDHLIAYIKEKKLKVIMRRHVEKR